MDRIDRDLKDPVRKPRTQSDKKRASLELARALFHFSALYVFIHKALVPFALRLLGVSIEAYSVVDPLFVPSTLVFCLSVFSKRLKQEWLLRLVLISLVLGIVDVALLFVHSFEGWLMISHVVSAFPITLSALWYYKNLDKTGFSFNFLNALIVFVASTLVVAVSYLQFPHKGVLVIKEEIRVEKTLPKIGFEGCSKMEGRLLFVNLPQKETRFFSLGPEGICPFVAVSASEEVLFSNYSTKPMNVHVSYVSADNKLKQAFNRLLTPGTNAEFRLKKDTLYMIYSDSAPNWGVSFLVSGKVDWLKKLEFSRMPLKAEVLNQ